MRGAQFVDPKALARIHNLELLARTVVDGFINGLHRAPHLGFSLDFAEHRGYEPGDDLRRVDWRVFARTDRYYVKQFEADSNANLVVALDVSTSMRYASGEVSKLDYGRFLAASIASRSASGGTRTGSAERFRQAPQLDDAEADGEERTRSEEHAHDDVLEQRVGDRFVVTKAEHNLIHELGGVPALERLQAVFESLSEEDRRHAHRALHLGIAINEHRDRFERGDFLVRNLVGADQTTGAVAVGDIVQEGQTVQFHLRDAQSASEDLNALLAADRSAHRHPPLGALLFSCCGRGQGLFGRPHHDATATAQRLGAIPLAGFFAQGEIGPVGGRNFLHGYTASMALFAERDR